MKHKETKPMARIVRDTRDARRDYFIPLDEARRLYETGKLDRIYMGDAYPNSFSKADT